MGVLLEEAVLDIPRLVGQVREAAVLQPPTLEQFLPNLEVDDIVTELQQMAAPIYNVASYRAWDTAPPFGRRQGFSAVEVEIAPLGLSLDITERGITRLRYQGMQDYRQGIRTAGAVRAFESLWDDALQCALATQIRVERARAELLVTGKITLNENGLKSLIYDPGVPGPHFITPATPWSTVASAVPVTDLKSAEALFRTDNSGRNPDLWLISEAVGNELALNAQVKTLAGGTSGVTPGLVSLDTVGQVLSVAGVRAPLVVFEGMTANPNTGAVERLISDRKVLGLRLGALGNTLFGTSASALMLVGEGRLARQDAPGIVAWVESEIRPAKIVTTAEGVALPVLRDSNAVMVLTV